MSVPYVELHCHSYYSLLDGSSSPEALVERAAALGYPALALTDHNGLYGIVRFCRAAIDHGVKPIVGAEVTLDDGGHLTLLAETQAGYANLCRLISAGQLAGQKGEPRLTLDMLAAHAGGLLCLSGCKQGPVAAALLAKDRKRACRAVDRLRDVFADRLWIELQRHLLPMDARLNASLVDLAHRMHVEIVATNDIHYAQPSGQPMHDVLTCIRHRTTLHEALASGLLHPNAERYLKAPHEMGALFADLPQALDNAARIAGRCHVCLDFADQRLPSFPVPKGHTPTGYLRLLCEEGLCRKLVLPSAQARQQLVHELDVIERLGLSDFFLVVWDIVRFAREHHIRCQGRGSAANSLVAYLLDITPVDPLQHDLLFERFLSEDAHTMPDIDVDFAADRREEVIQYVYERYGEEHVGMVCNVVTFRARSALRDVAKVLSFPADVIDRAAKALDTRSAEAAADAIDEILVPAQDGERDLPWQTLAQMLRGMEGIPRHLSIHVGGMLITAAPLVEVVPLERATMPGRVVVQWDKDSVEDASLIKIDLLSLRTLGMIEEALAHVRAGQGVELDLDRLPLDDPAVYDLLQQADTVGCFQVESRAQMQMLPRLRPTRFEDLIVEVALVRPGPIQGNMVHPYLKRRRGDEPVRYLHPDLAPILAETLGVMVFQEQVIRVARAIAGFAPGEADQLRRAMSRSRSQEAMGALRDRFLAGAQAHGVEKETAAEVFQQLMAFSGYGFCKSHAAAFALVAYQTLYLKAHFAAAFYCALLNHQPMGFYSPDVLIGDARRHGVTILRPDVNRSREACTLEAAGAAPAVRLGLRYVHGLGEAWQARLVERRGDRSFRDLRDLCMTTRLPRAVVENLIRCGAVDSLGRARRDLLWALGGMVYREEGLDLDVPVEPVELPELGRLGRLLWEYELLGLSPDDHVMGVYRERLRAQGVSSAGELASRQDGEVVRVAGLVVVRQRPPSAKGHVFLTLEDEEGLVNLIVRPRVYERYRDALRNAPLLLAEGRLQQVERTTSVLVSRAFPLVSRSRR
ncbi:MAG: DNA polymerase III subunit alpha [Anaerolineae bacterium]